MLIFMDTSSLVKRYIDESGTSDVDAYFQSKNSIFISAITPIEVHSTFREKSTRSQLIMRHIPRRTCLGKWKSNFLTL